MSKTIDPKHKEFQKLKRFVSKRFPGAHTIAKDVDGKLHYTVLDGYGYAIVDQKLMLPPALSVRKAWEHAKYAAWFSNMIRKSNNAFSDEKLIKRMSKHGQDY